MPYTVKIDPQVTHQPQAAIIPDASPFNDGVMTKEQAAAVAAIGNNLTPEEHERLRQLIHFISEGPGTGFASGAFKEVLPLGAPFPSSVTWYTSAAKTQKIVERLIVRNPNKTPSTITWKMYGDDGVTVVGTVVDTISYSSVFETTRTRTIT